MPGIWGAVGRLTRNPALTGLAEGSCIPPHAVPDEDVRELIGLVDEQARSVLEKSLTLEAVREGLL